MNLKKLVKLANHYDLKGEYVKADALDLFLKKASFGELSEEERKKLTDMIYPNQMSKEEASPKYIELGAKIRGIRDSKSNFEGRLEDIKKLEVEMRKFFDSAFYLGGSVVKDTIEALKLDREDIQVPDNYLEILKKELFPMLTEMVWSALYASELSNYERGFAYHSYLSLLSDLEKGSLIAKKEGRENQAKKNLVVYIETNEKIEDVLKDMTPNPNAPIYADKQRDPLQGEDFLRLNEKGFSSAVIPAEKYRRIREMQDAHNTKLEEKESQFYENEEE